MRTEVSAKCALGKIKRPNRRVDEVTQYTVYTMWYILSLFFRFYPRHYVRIGKYTCTLIYTTLLRTPIVYRYCKFSFTKLLPQIPALYSETTTAKVSKTLIWTQEHDTIFRSGPKLLTVQETVIVHSEKDWN